jgi:transposase
LRRSAMDAGGDSRSIGSTSLDCDRSHRHAFKGDPHGGDLYVFRGKNGKLLKILWHDGLGMSLYAKRLEHGRFIWPSPADGAVTITPAQLGYMLEGIDWRNPVHSFRPQAAG